MTNDLYEQFSQAFIAAGGSDHDLPSDALEAILSKSVELCEKDPELYARYLP